MIPEILSAFSMPVGFLLGGGSASSVLFIAYLLHSLLTLGSGLTEVAWWVWLSATDFLFIERCYATTGSVYAWTSGLVGVWLEPVRSYSWVMLRVATLVLAGSPTPTEIACWVSCLILHAVRKQHRHNMTIATCAVRVVMGVIAFLEAQRANPLPHDFAHNFARFLCLFAFLAIFLVRHATGNPKRLQSALTIPTTIILTQAGLFQAWRQYHHPQALLPDDAIHTKIAAFYTAYCVADTLFAYSYYSQYFTILEGWLHHTGTGALAIYYARQNKASLFCCGMMVETSTILLSLSRTFYDNKAIRRTYDDWFPTLFLLFRVVLPIGFLARIHHLIGDPVCLPAFGVFTILNLHWLWKMRQKKIRKIKETCTQH